MKLSSITEGSFGDLVSFAAARMGTGGDKRSLIAQDPRLQELVSTAKQFPYSLFDKRAVPWWKSVFEHFRVPPKHRREMVDTIRSQFEGYVDPSLYEGVLDFINPRTRQATSRSLARGATNERIAIEIINHVSTASRNIPLSLTTPAQKKAAVAGKIPEPPEPVANRPTKLAPAKGKRKCSICGQPGHNRRTCPDRSREEPTEPKRSAAEVSRDINDAMRRRPTKSDESVRFGCPDCGARLQSPASHAGSRMKCPNCKGVIAIPGA